MGSSLLARLTVPIPRGEDGYWQIIRELDQKGPWTVADVDRQCNVNKGTISAYCKRLRLGGFIVSVGERPHPRDQFGPAVLYRIARNVVLPPRLSADGSVRPEPHIERIWRVLKMSKTFTAREILHHLQDEDTAPSLNSIRTYLQSLGQAGIIVRADGGSNGGKPGGGREEARFRLLKSLGPQAPKVLTGKIVFDPNSGRVMAAEVVGEVSP